VISDHEAVEKTSWGEKAVPSGSAECYSEDWSVYHVRVCAFGEEKICQRYCLLLFVKCSRRKDVCTNLAEGLARLYKVRFDRSQSHLLPSP
jgi:hypothetical protein